MSSENHKYRLGKVLDMDRLFDAHEVVETAEFFDLTMKQMNEHVLLNGATGMGKSRLLRQLCREFTAQKIGYALIDMDGDTVEDVEADIACTVVDRGSKQLLKRVHLIDPSDAGRVPGYFPNRFELPPNIHPELREVYYRAWRHTWADGVSEVYQGKATGQSDFEGQPRRKRVLNDLFTAVGTMVDGKQLAVSDAKVLLDLGHDYHGRVVERLLPNLPREVRGDFEVLHQFKRIEDFRREAESSDNALRSLLGPTMTAMFSKTQPGEYIDPDRIVRNGEILLANLRPSKYWSKDQAVGLGTLLFHDIFAALMMSTPRHLRRPFVIIGEEMSAVLSDNLQLIGRLRKYGGKLIVSNQDLSGWRKPNGLDLTPKFLSQCGAIITFNQKWPLDSEILAKVQLAGNIDFTPLVHEVERRAGHTWVPVDETSEAHTRTKGKARSSATIVTNTESEQKSAAESHQKNAGFTRDDTGKIASTNTGSASALSNASMAGKAKAIGTQSGETDNESESYGLTINHKLVHLEKIVRELQNTGQLEKAVNDQMAKFTSGIQTLLKRLAVVKVPDNPRGFVIRTVEVPDAFKDAETQMKWIQWLKRELYQIHSYFFTPSLDSADEEKRLLEFVAGGQVRPDVEVDGQVNGHPNEEGHHRNGHADGPANGTGSGNPYGH